MAERRKLRRFSALVERAVSFARRRKLRVKADGRGGTTCCPLGAVVVLAKSEGLRLDHDASGRWPTCDVSSGAVAHLLGGKPVDWMDECRAFEVGFDDGDPDGECVGAANLGFYELGQRYRGARG